MEWLSLSIAFLIAGIAFAFVIGDASRLGHSEQRQMKRSKEPLDFDTDFL